MCKKFLNQSREVNSLKEDWERLKVLRNKNEWDKRN